MKQDGWPTFSFTDLLRPPEGWKTEHAILTTYSADLTVVVTALLALAGCDLDHRRTGSRVELVKAIDALRDRVCVLAQAGRVAVPASPRPVLKLLDHFLATIEADETKGSWHPKVALVRYQRTNDAEDCQWRVWVGSRNLTRSMNWDAGLTLVSQPKGKGQAIEGLADLAAGLAKQAKLPGLRASEVADEFAKLSWEGPPGCAVRSINLLGPETVSRFPEPPAESERVFVVSPFLDKETIRTLARWGNAKTRRSLVSTTLELQRLWQEDNAVFDGFEHVRVQPLPELLCEGAELEVEEPAPVAEPLDGEELPPAGLHAKLLFAGTRTLRQLWLGSANATQRGWGGHNHEVVAELAIARDTADAIQEFVAKGENFKPSPKPTGTEEDELALESARKSLSGGWPLRQKARDGKIEVVANVAPPLAHPSIKLEVATLGSAWAAWPLGVSRIEMPEDSQRSDFLQLRLICGKQQCAWIQIARCDPPPDQARDRALIAQYLDPRSFGLWLRSVLADEAARAGGGDWDEKETTRGPSDIHDRNALDAGVMPTVEEILRAWARDPNVFKSADEKVTAYLTALERRAIESGATADVELLQTFQRTWITLASELQ